MDGLTIKNFAWSYPLPQSFAVRITALDIPKNAALYLAGPSGSGKSTVLSLLAGVIASPLEVERSEVFPRVSYIMHQSMLAPWLRLGQNVRLEEKLRGIQADTALLAGLLQTFGLNGADILKMFPRQLSLGMRQRFEIAKSLAFHPDLLLLDEGFSGIDGKTRDIVISTLSTQLLQFGCAVIFTSHNLVDGLRLADFVVRVQDGVVSDAVPISSSRMERANLAADSLLRSPEATALA